MQPLIAGHRGRPADDLIFALSGEAQRRRAAGESIVNATLGTLMTDGGALGVLETVSRALQEVPREDWAAYAPISGMPEFLRAVVHDNFAGEPALEAAAVAVATPGGTGALRHAISNFLEPGQALLTSSYHWGPYQTLCDEQDRRLETFSMFKGGELDIAALDAKVGEQLAKQGRVLLFLNDPCQNPTGYSMRREEWRAVVDCLRSHVGKGPMTLLVDTAYSLYGSAADPRAFMAELRPLLGTVGLLFAWSASKSYTHYGLRVGALVACVADAAERRDVAAALSYSCRGTWSNCGRGGQVLITRMLTDPALARACEVERAQLKGILQERVAAFNRLAQARGIRYPRYEGGFFVTVFSSDGPAQAEAMRAMGVYVVPSAKALRVALCSTPVQDIPRLVEALHQVAG